MMRLVQAGSSEPRDLFILYLVGPQLDADLRRVLGPDPCIVAYVAAKPPERLEKTVADAKSLARFSQLGRICLVGYSLGCSGVRNRLLEGGDLLGSVAALLLVDGTHASKPPAAWQLDVWSREFERARKGELLAVATHTMQTYVETLPTNPFLATVTVLRKTTGFPLDKTGTIDAPAETAEGLLRVCSYASKTIDAQAHILQQRRALPDLLGRYVRPYLDELAGRTGLPRTSTIDAPVVGAEALEAAEKSRGSASPKRPPLHHLLRLGSVGAEVSYWQKIVGTHTDGIFDVEVEAATKQWQKDHGLNDDGIVGPISWGTAMEEAGASSGGPAAGEVPKVATPLSEGELAAVLEYGHHVALDTCPSRNRLACAWAQVALENGRGNAVWNNNLGNITAFGSWPGTYYVIRVAERVKRNPDVWKEINMRFRANADAVAGAADFWKVISGRYAAVLPLFDAGDAAGAAYKLSQLGYFTARADPYAKAMARLYQEFFQKNFGV